jgi:hypothetical protein
MSDYSTGKIYKIFVKGAEDLPYIGSTVSSLEQRLYMHRHQATSPTQKKSASCQMFEDGNDVEIQLLENYPCSSKLELEIRERYWLEQFPEAININTPTRTWKERWTNNKEHNLKKHKEWLLAHKEEIATQRASPAFRAKENEAHNARMANPEYAKAFKEKQSAIKKAKVECPVCKKVMNRNSLWEHNKKVHIPPLPT